MELSWLIFFSYSKREISELEKLTKNDSEKISYISGNGTF